MKLKHLFLILTIVFLGATCTAPKSAFDSASNKKFMGNVERCTIINRGFPLGKFTMVDTDIGESFFIEEKVKINVGTPCYVFSNSSGTKVFAVWEGAKQYYQIR